MVWDALLCPPSHSECSFESLASLVSLTPNYLHIPWHDLISTKPQLGRADAIKDLDLLIRLGLSLIRSCFRECLCFPKTLTEGQHLVALLGRVKSRQHFVLCYPTTIHVVATKGFSVATLYVTVGQPPIVPKVLVGATPNVIPRQPCIFHWGF
jgi:hypothetical protein